jgi:transcriptional regulator with XRE-family HTH domain
MIIGDRLKELREAKHLSQGDIEKRTGLLRCYISRVENGHTVPAIETLEKMARALELPLYHLMYDGYKAPEAPTALPSNGNKSQTLRLGGKDARYFQKLRRLLAKMKSDDREVLLYTVQGMTRRSKS